MNRKRINRWTAVSGHPSETQLRSISLSDYKSVLNIRVKGEGEQPIPPTREEVMAKNLGLVYRLLELSGVTLTEGDIERFRSAVADLPRPILIHGSNQETLEAIAVIDAGIEAGWSGDQAIERAGAIGVAWESPSIRDLVKSGVDRYLS